MNKIHLSLAGLLLAASAGSANAVAFANNSFELPDVSAETPVASGTQGWFATAGSYRTTTGAEAPDGDQYALFADTNQLYQNLTFAAGSYDVFFFAKGTGTASVFGYNVNSNAYDLLVQPAVNVASGSFTSYSYGLNVGTSTSYRLFFSNTGSDGDMGLDKVVITSAVPEPETYAMLIAGLGMVGFMARRRQSR